MKIKYLIIFILGIVFGIHLFSSVFILLNMISSIFYIGGIIVGGTITYVLIKYEDMFDDKFKIVKIFDLIKKFFKKKIEVIIKDG